MSGALLPIAAAREAVLSNVTRLPSEPVPLGIALGRTLAEPLAATADVPPFGNSAMDGFAVRAGASSGPLPIVAESRAGTPASRALADGEAIRISTGAPLPEGADAVVRVEDTREAGGRVELTVAVAPAQNVRAAGEDLKAGERVLEAGTRLGPAELAVAVGAGAGTVACARRPRVAILCTGDELREPGAPLGPGEIHNSNAVMLAALAQQEGAEVVAVERVADDRAATEAAFADALERSDVVIASGGVSVGPHDHVKPALTALGVQERFWRVSLQPGKPTWFGTRGERLVLGLPGNPVSSYVTFLLFARPALRALQGAAALPPRERALLGRALPRRGREQVVRVALRAATGDGDAPLLTATPTGPQGSHITRSLLGADGLAFVPSGDGEVAAGTAVEVERI